MASIRSMISSLTALPHARLGQCESCTRAALAAAILAWMIAAATWLAWRRLDVALATALVAAALTGLWIAHLANRGSRGTVGALLRAFGATAGEASAIVAAFAQPAGRAWRLQDGETIRVQLAPRPNGKGTRLARVVIADGRGVVAAVGLAEGGAYAPLERAAAEIDAAP